MYNLELCLPVVKYNPDNNDMSDDPVYETDLPLKQLIDEMACVV